MDNKPTPRGGGAGGGDKDDGQKPQTSKSAQTMKSTKTKGNAPNPKSLFMYDKIDSGLPAWKLIQEHMKVTHHEYKREKIFRQMGIRTKYSGYKGTLTAGDLDSCSVSTVSTPESNLSYVVNDNILLYEPFIDKGVGTSKIRLMSSDLYKWIVDIEVVSVLKPLRRQIQQMQLEDAKDTPVFNVFLCLDRMDHKLINMLLDWLFLHKDEVPGWIDLEDDHSFIEPKLGSTEPFNDIKPVDQMFLDNLLPRVTKFICKAKYDGMLLDLARASVEMELFPLQLLLKKYLTNYLHGKAPKKIWQTFNLLRSIPKDCYEEDIYFSSIVTIYQEKLKLIREAKENEELARESAHEAEEAKKLEKGIKLEKDERTREKEIGKLQVILEERLSVLEEKSA